MTPEEFRQRVFLLLCIISGELGGLALGLGIVFGARHG